MTAAAGGGPKARRAAILGFLALGFFTADARGETARVMPCPI